jgi:hypothetical protein
MSDMLTNYNQKTSSTAAEWAVIVIEDKTGIG